jgi:FKBP-type peptidyl-prolyl cis-trans isomerase FklB
MLVKITNMMKNIAYSALILLTAIVAVSCQDKGSSSVTLRDATDTISYGIGVNMGKGFVENRKRSSIDSINSELVWKGFKDAIESKEIKIDPELIGKLLREADQKGSSQVAEKNLQKAKDFLAANKSKEGIVEMPSGLQYKILKQGEGDSVRVSDTVTVHYHGTKIDGTVFDSSKDRGQPFRTRLVDVIPGWLALQVMKVGGKCILFIPPDMAYKEQGGGPIQPNELLIFEIEVLERTPSLPDKK